MEIVEQVVDKTCALWGITREEIMGHCRKHPLPLARAMVTWYFKKHSSMLNKDIAKILNRHRTSIYNDLKILDYSLKYDKEFIRNYKILVRSMQEESLKDNVMDIIKKIMYGSCNF